jgi:hypothetical protein
MNGIKCEKRHPVVIVLAGVLRVQDSDLLADT